MATALHLAIDPSRPRARALEAALREAIRAGRLGAGTQLPPSRVLADDLGIARATVVEVYSQLQAEGYLVSRRGAGTWVAQLPPRAPRAAAIEPLRPRLRFDFDPGLPDLTAFPRAAWVRALRRGLRHAPAGSLGYAESENVWAALQWAIARGDIGLLEQMRGGLSTWYALTGWYRDWETGARRAAARFRAALAAGDGEADPYLRVALGYVLGHEASAGSQSKTPASRCTAGSSPIRASRSFRYPSTSSAHAPICSKSSTSEPSFSPRRTNSRSASS